MEPSERRPDEDQPRPLDTVEKWESRMREFGMMDVTWAHTGPNPGREPGLVFSLRDQCGVRHRFRIPAWSAREIVETFNDYLARYECVCHSDKSSGMPSSPVSTPQESENVCPPERSDAAPPGQP
jgi:hypothetical protein